MKSAALIWLPFSSQIASCPPSVRHSRSPLPSPSKSAAPSGCQSGPGVLITVAPIRRKSAPIIWVPSISQTASLPESVRQRMSVLPSPLTSLVSMTCQSGPGSPTALAPSRVKVRGADLEAVHLPHRERTAVRARRFAHAIRVKVLPLRRLRRAGNVDRDGLVVTERAVGRAHLHNVAIVGIGIVRRLEVRRIDEGERTRRFVDLK